MRNTLCDTSIPLLPGGPRDAEREQGRSGYMRETSFYLCAQHVSE